jgi:hypothetical protein
MQGTNMKTITTNAAAAFLVTAIGFSAVAPVMAQATAPAAGNEVTQPQDMTKERPPHRRGDHGPRGMHAGAGSVLDFGRGAEAIEVALVRISHRIDLTDEQQGLFDTLKTSALGAADAFATAIKDLRPTPPAAGEARVMPDFSERLEKRIAFEKAQLAALEAVQPSASAFFDSLSDEQKAQLAPERGDRGERGGREHGPRGGFGPRR